MNDAEPEHMPNVEKCPQCFRRGFFQEGEVCDGCANIDEYYEICVYCDKPNYEDDGDICFECIKIVNDLNRIE